MGSGDGVWQWAPVEGAGQLHSRSGRGWGRGGWEACGAAAWLPHEAVGSAEGQTVTWQGNMMLFHPLLH